MGKSQLKKDMSDLKENNQVPFTIPIKPSITELLQTQETLNEEIRNWLQTKAGQETFFSKLINSSQLKEDLKERAEKPEFHSGFKKFYNPENKILKEKLVKLKTNSFFISLLANEIEFFIKDSLKGENNFHITQAETLLVDHANYIFNLALREYFNYRDEETDIWNKRALKTVYQKEIKDDKESGTNQIYIFVFFDIDRFKKVNDEFEHQTGNQAIAALVEAAKEVFAEMAYPSDIIARLHGDEFAAIFKSKADSLQTKEKRKSFGRRVKTIFNQIEKVYQEKLVKLIAGKEKIEKIPNGETLKKLPPFIFGDTISVGYDIQLNPRKDLEDYLTLAENETKNKKRVLRDIDLEGDAVEAQNSELKTKFSEET